MNPMSASSLLLGLAAAAALTSDAQAAETRVKKLRKLVLCQIENAGTVSVDYKTGDRISSAQAAKNGKRIDTKRLAKLSDEAIRSQFADAGVTVVGFEEFLGAYEEAAKADLGKMGAALEAAGAQQDAAALSGINASMRSAAAANPAIAAAQAAAKDGGPKGAAGGAVSDAQMAAVLNNPDIPEATKAVLRKSMASGQRVVTGAAPVMGIPAGMRDGTGDSRFNAGAANAKETGGMFQQMLDSKVSAMREAGAAACPAATEGRPEGPLKRGKEKAWFWQALDKVGAVGYVRPSMTWETGGDNASDASYGARTDAYTQATAHDNFHVPALTVNAAFFDGNGGKLLDGVKRPPTSGILKGKSSAELQQKYEEALPTVVGDLAAKLYR